MGMSRSEDLLTLRVLKTNDATIAYAVEKHDYADWKTG